MNMSKKKRKKKQGEKKNSPPKKKAESKLMAEFVLGGISFRRALFLGVFFHSHCTAVLHP